MADAPLHAVRIIRAEGARKGIKAMVIALVSTIVAALFIYAVTSGGQVGR